MQVLGPIAMQEKEHSILPTVSIVIPFYSGRDWLIEALDSVVAQTFNDWEALIVNDGSPEPDDEIVRYVQSDERFRYFIKSNGGPASARNYAIGRVRGEFIAFLDSDDLWEPEKLERQIEFFSEHPEHSWVHCGYSTFIDGKNELTPVDNSNFAGQVFPKILISSEIATPCIMVRTSILRQDASLRFNEDMRYGQDGYFWTAIASKYPLGYCEGFLARVRVRGSNAAGKAYPHLVVRSHLSDYLPIAKGLPASVRLAYAISKIGFSVIDRLFGVKSCRHPDAREAASKVVYAPAFMLFRLSRLCACWR